MKKNKNRQNTNIPSEACTDTLSEGALKAMDDAYDELLNTDIAAEEDAEAPSSDTVERTDAADAAECTDTAAADTSGAEGKEAAAPASVPEIPDLMDLIPTEEQKNEGEGDDAGENADAEMFHMKHSDGNADDTSEESDSSDASEDPDELEGLDELIESGIDDADNTDHAASDNASADPAPASASAGGSEDIGEDEDDDFPESDAPGEPPRRLSGNSAENAAQSVSGGTAGGYSHLGLYVHIPFCKSKCAYCDFYSTDKIRCSGRHAPIEMKNYCSALKNQMKFFSERTTQYNIDTVFFGGGTPTALSAPLLLSLVKEVWNDFYLETGYEFTVEMNPATAELSLLKKLRRAGVNRLSIGLQSAHDHELAALSRIHKVGDFAMAFQSAREAGFTNINVDVMYGIPEQTAQSFRETLEFVCSMKPEHISMYNLRIEDGTPFGEKKAMLPLPDEDTECAMYFDGIAYLAEHGYKQYEISNFAREGYECRHNLRYWRGEEYIGCGPAAHSYFGGRRFSLKHSLSAFCSALSDVPKVIPNSLLDESYVIDRREELAEYLMLRLRLCEGISVRDFQAHFGADFEHHFAPKLKFYIDNGFMQRTVFADGDARYAFTPKGMFVSNYILARIIPFEPKYAHSSSVLGGGSAG